MKASLSPERWEQIHRLFAEVVDLAPEPRAARLDADCADDPDLREEIESLLMAYSQADDLLHDLDQMVKAPPSPAAATPLTTGRRVAHYEMLEELGGGGMGVVYKARDTKLGRFVALKFLPPAFSTNAAAKARFIHEAKAASALDHPNICTIHEIGETDDGELFIAMAFYPGETLKKKIQRGPLPLDEALNYARQIARGLSKAHTTGIVHRDVKPANVMITDDGIVKTVDFGLAKVGNVQLTQTGTMIGTVAYMSPEQARSEEVDQRTDVWALGVVLYEMLTGERPFRGDFDLAVIYSVLNEEPKPLTDINPEVPQALERIVRRCLEKERDSRYPSASALLADLEGWTAIDTSSPLQNVHHAPHQKPSIAVLPFVDLSPEKDQEYFGDGMAEELSTALSNIEEWRVVSRSSAFAFKGKDLDIRKIGRQLDVSHILEGSVRKAGTRLRIRVELVNVNDGFQLWSEHYNRELEDVFTIQEDIAQAIVDKLRIQLIDAKHEALIKQHTNNMDAYHLYLKARFHLNKRTEAGLKKCKTYCERALAEDPGYALAYAGLADCLILLGFQGAASPNEVMPQAKAAAEKALELDASLSEAHTSLGCIRAVYDWDWPGAERAFQQALALNPNYATAHHWQAIWHLLPTGQFDDALAALRKAQELDPISQILNAGIGWCHLFARRFDEAIDELKKTLDMDENFVVAHDLLGQAYVQQGRYDEAIAALEKAVRLSGGRTLSLASLGHAYARAGRKDDAQRVLDDLRQRTYQRHVSPYDVALIYIGLDEHDQALAWLEKAYEEHSGWLGFLNVEPRFDPLRSETQFTSLLKRVG